MYSHLVSDSLTYCAVNSENKIYEYKTKLPMEDYRLAKVETRVSYQRTNWHFRTAVYSCVAAFQN